MHNSNARINRYRNKREQKQQENYLRESDPYSAFIASSNQNETNLRTHFSFGFGFYFFSSYFKCICMILSSSILPLRYVYVCGIATRKYLFT